MKTLDELSGVLTHLWPAPEHFTFTHAVKTAIDAKRTPSCRAGSMGGGAAVGLDDANLTALEASSTAAETFCF